MKKLNSLMLLALVLLLFSCRTEILNDETTTASPEKNKFQLTSKRISLDQSPHKLSLLSEINKIETELKKSKQNAFGKTIDHVDGVSIDSEHVIYIENGPNYHTYTFNIKNTPGSLLQNLVLTPLPDGSYKKLIFTYNFTDAEKLNIFKGIPVDTKGKTSITDLNNPTISAKAGGCVYAEETIWHECSEGIHNESNLAEWALCTASAPPSVYTIAYWNCAGGNGSSDGGNGNNPGNGNGGNGPGSGSGCVADAFENPTDPVNSPGPCSGGVPTQPNISTSFAWFLYYLPDDLGSVISTNQISDFYQGFKAYYDANANTPQAIDFIIWGLQFKKDNPNVSWEQFNNWFIKGNLNYKNSADIEYAINLITLIHDLSIANENGTINQLQASWPSWQKMKQKIKSSIAEGIHETAKVVKTFYNEIQSNPYIYNVATKTLLNIYIDELREEIRQTTNMNKNTMNWQDLFNIWLFELMPSSSSSLHFTWSSNVINGNTLYNPLTNAVYTFPKGSPSMITDIKNGLSNGTFNVGSIMSKYFHYNFTQYYATLSNSNVGIQMLGSYDTKATVISKTSNSAVIRFYIPNILGWDSATRFVRTNDGTIGIIPNKEIGEDIHLGGNLTNTYTWEETITF